MGPKFKRGDPVDKARGYRFPGRVVAVFETLGDQDLRYVVQLDDYRLLHIFNEEQLVARNVDCWGDPLRSD